MSKNKLLIGIIIVVVLVIVGLFILGMRHGPDQNANSAPLDNATVASIDSASNSIDNANSSTDPTQFNSSSLDSLG